MDLGSQCDGGSWPRQPLNEIHDAENDMGLLGKIWDSVKGAESVDMILARDVGGATGGAEFVPNECYVELYVQSLRLRNVRRFTQRYDGVVYSFVTLPFLGQAKVRIPAVSKPDNLVQLDPGAIANVITFNKQMMGAVPWRGGPLLLELGLFSVKGGNLLTPVLDFVTEISSVAGVSFVGKIAPFAPLISKGVDLLAGQTSDVALEVGIDTSFDIVSAGTHAIIAEPKDGRIDKAKLSLDPTDGKLLHDGSPLRASYCVFSIRSTTTKADYGEIPELKEKYAAFHAALQTQVEDKAKEALTAFRVAALTSPDLIRSDAKRLVALAEEMMTDVFGGGQVSLAPVEHLRGADSLDKVPLYAT
jgi:hypothetical protein